MVSLSNHRRRKMVEPLDKPQPLPQEGCNYRLAVNPDTGEHGYEIGYWPAGASEASDYVVLARCYDQQEAARLANAHNAMAPGPYEPASAEAPVDEDEEETPHRRRRR